MPRIGTRFKFWLTGALLLAASCLLVDAAFSASQQELHVPAYSTEFNICMEKASGTTVAMRACTVKELRRQDVRLNQVYKTYIGSLEPPLKQNLKTAQLAWIKFKEAQCAFSAANEGEATLGPLIVSSCQLQMTADRAAEIEKQTGSN